MSLILLIDTCGDNAFLCVCREGIIIAKQDNAQQNQHASFIHIAIDNLFKTSGLNLKDIDAVAVVNGPGSYTGLRVGLSSAKGICYALNKPLILLNTLFVMAMAMKNEYRRNNALKGNEIFCPLIDARRMEVYTCMYNNDLNEELQQTNLIVEENTFDHYLQYHFMVFGGNGSLKVENILSNNNCIYYPQLDYSREASIVAENRFNSQQFDSLAYSEPFYLKEFYSK